MKRIIAPLGLGLTLLSGCSDPQHQDRLTPPGWIVVAGDGPVYPAAAQEQNREGFVDVSCDISPEGLPHDCRVAKSAGGSDLEASALAFVQRQHFSPGMLNDKPVPFEGQTLHLAFSLEDDQDKDAKK